ncbi:FHA domain-containing protein [Microvenator marinus]|jgi:DNA-binding NtrC family response regulator|uniref:FHA domain-containing protein n=1 Tax=Microvenator marinus TaxID=2600177 RepID=A0A5B8XQB5_9DELT|nr:sigma 54-interacting transcriptional regulator [Microvenator marinus]QED26253.1 FHA domain-containing protein [Microvenator marinus]
MPLYGKSQPTKIAYVDGRPKTLHLRKARLLIHPGLPKQRELVFDQNVISIGTVADNDVVIEDETVSRHHCRIVQEDDDYVLVDPGSTNGTFINGVRIREAFLAPGLILTVGSTQIQFSPMDEHVEVVPSESEKFGSIVGRSVAMREIFGILEKIAPTTATVVIEGETGTGKEVFAKTIHQMSKRSEAPFIVFDCGAVPESLIESELFGHEKGSFTGAIMTRKGLFEMAHGGTIFLDELGELSLDLQPKLLRVLEQREVRRVGSNKSTPVNVRVIAATNRNLEEEVRAGRFREDLFYRLSVVRLTLPSLRERVEDIPLLVKHFLGQLEINKGAAGELRVRQASPAALAALTRYTWPGNVRELVNVVERACSFAEADTMQPDDLPDYITGSGEPLRSSQEMAMIDAPGRDQLVELPFKDAKEEWISSFERDYILELLKRHHGNISQASREADIDRKYFRKLMVKHGIDTDQI